MRVVSCVPSLSELAEELSPGCLAGRTRYCIAPSSISKVSKIGGTKDLDVASIIRINPDLVLSVKEENEKCQIEELNAAGIPVEVFDIRTLKDAIAMVIRCGSLLGNEEMAGLLASEMQQLADQPKLQRGTVLYFIWKNPWMVAGRETFIGNLLELCGYENLAAEGTRYPQLQDEELLKLNPGTIFLSSEPYPFREKHRKVFLNNFPNSPVYCVDGSIFSWYGRRTTLLPSYLNELLEND
jgi:ABC-type Fe3+-hydroxamate transport system substrate-binding protein